MMKISSTGEDARDDYKKGVLRQPGHGTRTASILIGNEPGKEITNDGNQGLFIRFIFRSSNHQSNSV